MFLLRIAAALCATAAVQAAPRLITKRDGPSGGIAWGDSSQKVRGVNLGGWLVIEPWITPSLFQGFDPSEGVVDEWSLKGALERKLGEQRACTTFRDHRETFVTLKDFQKIRDSGFNLVRIPIGYWAFDDHDSRYETRELQGFLDKGIGWARQVGLKVIIDLHGAPGSQNGFDNSGRRTANPEWQLPENIDRTLNVLGQIQQKYGQSEYDDVVAAIEALNEPLDPVLNPEITRDFHRRAYRNQREKSYTRFHDGFLQTNTFNGFLTPTDFDSTLGTRPGPEWVVIDHHEYSCFREDLVAQQPWQHRQHVCNNVGSYYGEDKWSIVGEWSAAVCLVFSE
ncbi:hypothetical protein Q7P37_003897 [Cladosporium fusiforme]